MTQHLALCRHYVRELRRSVLIETPELEKAGSKRSSMMLDNFGEVNDPAGPSTHLDDVERGRDQHLSAYLRQQNGANGGANHSPHSSLGSQYSQQSAMRGSGDRQRGSERPPRPSFMSGNLEHMNSDNSPAHTVARDDLRASAEKILYTFLLPNSEREIGLPAYIINDATTAIEDDGRDDPEVFDAAKDYVYTAMERDAFPGFLRSKALGNLVPPSIAARLALGLIGMFGGFWAGFACIFLDRPKHIRAWVSCFPFIFYFNVDFQYSPGGHYAYPLHLRSSSRLQSVSTALHRNSTPSIRSLPSVVSVNIHFLIGTASENPMFAVY